MRRGFTLVEMMVTSGILVLVVGGTFSAFIGVQRMTKSAFAEAELSIGMRELREKLLFHAAPAHDDRMWSGILSGASSGTPASSDATIKMEMSSGYDTVNSQAVSQNIELTMERRVSGGSESRCFVNDGDTYDEYWTTRWLDPVGYSWLPETDFIVAEEMSKRNVFYINLEATASGVTRRERIVVPVFGKAQRTFAGKVFDDD